MRIFLILIIMINYSLLAAPAPKKKNLTKAEQDKIADLRWTKLIKLINDEIKTIQTNKYTGPELKHRLFELYSEKIKLIKEKENMVLLRTDLKIINEKGKESFFKLSHEQYMATQKFGLVVIKTYPTYKQIGELYYAMAINSRDFGTPKETEAFLKLAVQHSKEKSKTMYNAKVALAEYYYNEKRYAEAIQNYNEVLLKKDDEWYGKHLYNASWCYLKERDPQKALSLIKDAFFITKSKKSELGLVEQITSAIGIFFNQADKIYEGITFFEANTMPASTNLIALAKTSMSRNDFNLTNDVLQAALRDTKKRKNAADELSVRLVQLDIYRETKKEDLYYQTAEDILALHKVHQLPPADLEVAVNKIKDVAGFMQINLVKSKNNTAVTFNKTDFTRIIGYFDILSQLNAKNKYLYRYYQGETYLSTLDYANAFKYYVRALMNSKKIKVFEKDQADLTKKIIESMLFSLDNAKFEKAIDDKYTIYTLKNYLIVFPISEKSQAIYQKLFNKYFEMGKYQKAINILNVYSKLYPADEAVFRDMLTQVLEVYIKHKNTDYLTFWVNKIEIGLYHFKEDYIKKSIGILGALLFEKYQKLEKKGNLKEALAGYNSIYSTKKYPAKIKADAAYSIGTILLQLNQTTNSFKWISGSITIYNKEDTTKLAESLLNVSRTYQLLQNFKYSTAIAESVSQKLCNTKFPQKDALYEVLITNDLILNPTAKDITKREEDFKTCEISKKMFDKLQLESFTRLILNDPTFTIESETFLNIKRYYESHIAANSPLSAPFASYLRYKFWYSTIGPNRDKIRQEISGLDAKYNDLNLKNMFSKYDEVMAYRKKIQELKFILGAEEPFNEEKFNTDLESYFGVVNDLTAEGNKISNKAAPEEIALIREVISRPYSALAEAIEMTTPKGMDSAYVDGFKGQMGSVLESLNAKSKEFDNEKINFFKKNQYFLESQKYAKLYTAKGNQSGLKYETMEIKESTEKVDYMLNFHDSSQFINTLDLNKGWKK